MGTPVHLSYDKLRQIEETLVSLREQHSVASSIDDKTALTKRIAVLETVLPVVRQMHRLMCVIDLPIE